MKTLIAVITIVVLWGIIFCSCQFPYSPSQEHPVEQTKETTPNSVVKVFPVNGGKQTCNVSISLDTVNFRGCMLWLNFGGTLVQKVPDALADFPLTAGQHDRLTITDSSNTVRWFMMRDEAGGAADEQFQDPEWSANPGYIICLLSSQMQKKWNCVAINLLTRDKFNICKETMAEDATPHLWVSDSQVSPETPSTPVYDSTGFADRESVESFFGTADVKVVYSRRESGILSLYYTDYGAGKISVKLSRPEGRQNWNLESPLISPDGNWIVYNAYENTRYYECYIQQLAPGSVPVLLAQGASDPHWWVHPDDRSLLYVIYTTIPGDNLVLEDLSDTDLLESGDAGITWRQQVKLFPGRSSTVSVIKTGNPDLLVKLPLKGGLSPDGRFMCTGYSEAYVVFLN